MQHRCDMTRYRGDLQRYIQSSTRISHDAEDIVQEVFLRFHARADARALDRPVGYLIAMARNLMIDHSRRSNPLRNAVRIEELGDHVLATAPEQEQARRVSDLKGAYESALAELAPRCREVFVLRRHDQVDTREAAARFGTSPRMVQKYMARATAHLEERLSGFTDRTHSAPSALRAPMQPPGPGLQLSDLL